MKAYTLASLAAAGALCLAAACSHKEPEDVTPSTTPSASTAPTSETAGAAGAVTDSTAISPDTMHAPGDTVHMPSDSALTVPSADSAAQAAHDSM